MLPKDVYLTYVLTEQTSKRKLFSYTRTGWFQKAQGGAGQDVGYQWFLHF